MVPQSHIKLIRTKKDLAIAHGIRKKVFVEEQGADPALDLEFDDEATHFLIYYGKKTSWDMQGKICKW